SAPGETLPGARLPAGVDPAGGRRGALAVDVRKSLRVPRRGLPASLPLDRPRGEGRGRDATAAGGRGGRGPRGLPRRPPEVHGPRPAVGPGAPRVQPVLVLPARRAGDRRHHAGRPGFGPARAEAPGLPRPAPPPGPG